VAGGERSGRRSGGVAGNWTSRPLLRVRHARAFEPVDLKRHQRRAQAQGSRWQPARPLKPSACVGTLVVPKHAFWGPFDPSDPGGARPAFSVGLLASRAGCATEGCPWPRHVTVTHRRLRHVCRRGAATRTLTQRAAAYARQPRRTPARAQLLPAPCAKAAWHVRSATLLGRPLLGAGAPWRGLNRACCMGPMGAGRGGGWGGPASSHAVFSAPPTVFPIAQPQCATLLPHDHLPLLGVGGSMQKRACAHERACNHACGTPCTPRSKTLDHRSHTCTTPDHHTKSQALTWMGSSKVGWRSTAPRAPAGPRPRDRATRLGCCSSTGAQPPRLLLLFLHSAGCVGVEG